MKSFPKAGRVIALAAAVLCMGGCDLFPDPRALIGADLKPPTLLGSDKERGGRLRLYFDEEVRVVEPGFRVAEGGPPARLVACADAAVIIDFEGLNPGECYLVRGMVSDEAGNCLSFSLPYWAPNPELARVLISECHVKGDADKPDFVELVAIGGGSLAGMALYDGSRGNHSARYIFGSARLDAGQRVVLLMKPAKQVFLSKVSPGALVLIHPDAPGLSGTTGAVALYESPDGAPIDAILYSNRGSDASDSYGGFGSKAALQAAVDLYAEGMWRGAGNSPSPDDAARTEALTATRSLNRNAFDDDTDEKGDWHVCGSGGLTPGGPSA
jgi:hypothetical protein